MSAKPTCRCGEPDSMGSDVSDVHECLHSPTNMVYKCRLVSLYFVFVKMLYARDRAIYPQPYSTNEKAQFVRKSATRLIFSMPCISARLAPQCTYQASQPLIAVAGVAVESHRVGLADQYIRQPCMLVFLSCSRLSS